MPAYFKGGNVVLPCTCKHDFQDAKYGKGMRVHVVGKDDKKAACTVCESKKNL